MTAKPLVQPNQPSLVTLNAPLTDPNWGMERSAASPTRECRWLLCYAPEAG